MGIIWGTSLEGQPGTVLWGKIQGGEDQERGSREEEQGGTWHAYIPGEGPA